MMRKEEESSDLDLRPEAAPGLLHLDRRQFLKLLSGGVIVFLSGDELAAGEALPSDFNAFLRIGEDGRVACFTGKIEMGQGIITSLAQMLAEELDVPLACVDMVMGDTDLCPWDMGTFGSMSTKYFGPPLREAAAEARAVLVQLAAEELKLPPERLTAKDGSVFDPGNPSSRVSYASLARGKRIERRLGKKPTLKDPSEFKVSGKPQARLDGLEKATGRAKYAADIRLPGMLYAKVLRPPAHGAKLASLDTSRAEKLEGVQVVRDGDLIAVLHPTPDGAERALEEVQARFDLPGAEVDDTTIFDHLWKARSRENVVARSGDLEEGRKLARTTFEETYRDRYVAHAPIEPHAALASVEGGKATVWASTQRPFGVRDEVARALGLPAAQVRVITPFVGGGFGGKTKNLQAVEAARLSKLAGKPVQVAYSREEEFFLDNFKPAAIVKISSGLDEKNRIVLWDYHVYFAGDRDSAAFYDIPHALTSSQGGFFGGGRVHPFDTGAWRAPGSNTNTFARECHIDLMAARAGLDPLEFRLLNLKDERMRRVLDAAAKAFRWTPAKAPSGRGHGLACGIYMGTYLAAMAEVQVDKEKCDVRVKRIAYAQDTGQTINPEGARMQMEGALTMGLGYALSEEVRFKGGDILDRNFDTYEIPRFSRVPAIETVLLESPGVPPQGCGEPAITCVAAVLANAAFDAAGARLFELPMTPERVRKAIAGAKEKRS